MYKFIAITDARLADGFRLGGVEVIGVTSLEEAHDHLVRLMAADDVGIIVLDELYQRAIDERLQRRIDAQDRPVVILLPFREDLDIEKYMNQRMRTRIRQAIGFDIAVSKGA